MIKRGNKGAMELSIGTIVIIVLAMTMLIMGMVLIRTIMCSGLQITTEIDQGVRNEVINMFGSGEYGVRCIGEGNQEITLAGGGRRNTGCEITVSSETKYEIVPEVESIGGADTDTVKGWIMDSGGEWDVIPGDSTTAPALVMNIPDNVPDTTIRIDYQVKNLDTGTEQTRRAYVDVTHAGTLTMNMC